MALDTSNATRNAQMEDSLRSLVQHYLDNLMHANAIFLCERLVACNPREENVLLLATCHVTQSGELTAHALLQGCRLPESRLVCFEGKDRINGKGEPSMKCRWFWEQDPRYHNSSQQRRKKDNDSRTNFAAVDWGSGLSAGDTSKHRWPYSLDLCRGLESILYTKAVLKVVDPTQCQFHPLPEELRKGYPRLCRRISAKNLPSFIDWRIHPETLL